MAYGVDAPQGFVPVTTTTGATFNAATVQYFNIDPAQASNDIYVNDAVVYSHTNGGSWIARIAAGTQSATTVGTFLSCQYVVPQAGNPNGTVINGYWPSGITLAAGTSVVATVLMDPTIVYDIQVNSGVANGATSAMQFNNAQIIAPANGNQSTGISGQSLATPAAGNATYPCKVIGLSTGGGGSNVWGIANNNVYVKFNTPVWATGTAGV